VALPRTRRPPLTYDEYRLLPDDGKRYELMEGDLFVSPAPSPRHQTVSRRLQFALMQALELPGRAQVFNAPIDVILEPTTVVQPDLVIVRADQKHIITGRGIEGVPDVVVEILSPGSLDRDAHLKLRVYERFAIPEYWIVDPDHGFVEAFRHQDGGYRQRARPNRAGTLTCPDFPEVAIALADVFRED
jgi:Uma2 family endonuclease